MICFRHESCDYNSLQFSSFEYLKKNLFDQLIATAVSFKRLRTEKYNASCYTLETLACVLDLFMFCQELELI